MCLCTEEAVAPMCIRMQEAVASMCNRMITPAACQKCLRQGRGAQLDTVLRHPAQLPQALLGGKKGGLVQQDLRPGRQAVAE